MLRETLKSKKAKSIDPAGELIMGIGFVGEFEALGSRIWLNCAHQGPLPVSAVGAAYEAIRQKASPNLIADSSFNHVPTRLRKALGHLLTRPPEEVVLGNSASYGAHIIANGFPWERGDEVLLVTGDFPATALPWCKLHERGVSIRFIAPRNGFCVDPDEIVRAIHRNTRLLCVSWVNPFNGWRVDIDSIGQICRNHGVWFVVNGSQGVGTSPINPGTTPIDGLFSCGYKWLCGPYGTGFLWIRPEFLDLLHCDYVNWSTVKEWDYEREACSIPKVDFRQHDMFCTANFLNFMPWSAAVELFNRHSFIQIFEYNMDLSKYIVDYICHTKYRLISPVTGESRSSIVVLSHQDPSRNVAIQGMLSARGIDVAIRRNNLRISPHVYNTAAQMATVCEVLNEIA